MALVKFIETTGGLESAILFEDKTQDGISFEWNEKLFCSCKMPDNGERYMLCTQCENWYHLKCIKSISKNEAKSSVSWRCELCTSKKTGIPVPEFSNSDSSDSEEVNRKISGNS